MKKVYDNLIIINLYIIDQSHLVEMSSSWNFLAQASPSYEGSEPSRAGAP